MPYLMPLLPAGSRRQKFRCHDYAQFCPRRLIGGRKRDVGWERARGSEDTRRCAVWKKRKYMDLYLDTALKQHETFELKAEVIVTYHCIRCTLI
jgi:hypothetical protein